MNEPTTQAGREIVQHHGGYHTEDCGLNPYDGATCDCQLAAMVAKAEAEARAQESARADARLRAEGAQAERERLTARLRELAAKADRWTVPDLAASLNWVASKIESEAALLADPEPQRDAAIRDLAEELVIGPTSTPWDRLDTPTEAPR